MIKIDLITGFLGSGKTTFIKKYARYLMNNGMRIGILENDFGAINVDMLLLNELRGEKCELEMVAGGCDADCHRRRFKTKLISMAMCGYERVLVEPSGIFDLDEFFDVLREEPLDNWYEIGNVIGIVDSGLNKNMTDVSDYLLASELSCAGCILLSKVNGKKDEIIADTKQHIEEALRKVKCERAFLDEYIIKDWEYLDEKDFEKILNSGYKISSYEKKNIEDEEIYDSLYFMETGITKNEIKEMADKLLKDESYGKVYRVKGFVKNDENGFYEINATRNEFQIKEVKIGQEVIIIIGENLQEMAINTCLKTN